MTTNRRRRSGSGSVFRRKTDGRWVAQVRRVDPATGESRVVRRYADSRDAARALLAELRAGTEAPPRRRPEGLTVADYLEAWASDSLPVSGLRPNTQAMYASLVGNPLKPTLGDVLLSTFTPSQAEAWLQRLAVAPKVRGKGSLSQSTQRSAYQCLKRALDTAVRDGLIESNPLDRVARPSAGRPVVYATPADAVDSVVLPAVAGTPIGPLVTFVALTGCRVGEASGLRWEDVDLKAGVATIRRSSVTADTTKTDRVRSVPLLPEVVEALKGARARQREDRLRMGEGWQDTVGLVFTDGTGSPLDLGHARRQLRAVLVANGLPPGRPFHSLRHGLASRLLERDVPMAVVSAIMGHSSVAMTVDVYGHINPAMHADRLAVAMGRA